MVSFFVCIGFMLLSPEVVCCGGQTRQCSILYTSFIRVLRLFLWGDGWWVAGRQGKKTKTKNYNRCVEYYGSINSTFYLVVLLLLYLSLLLYQYINHNPSPEPQPNQKRSDKDICLFVSCARVAFLGPTSLALRWAYRYSCCMRTPLAYAYRYSCCTGTPLVTRENRWHWVRYEM